MKELIEIKKIAEKCLKCKNALCSKACPINNPIPEILKFVENENLEGAKKLLFENSNGTIVCSKLCDFKKNCYGHCILNNKNQPIPFYKVESYLSDSFNTNYITKDNLLKNLNVIIFGAGISGISLAIDLAKSNANVTLVEKESKIGGVIHTMLPRFRFDDSILTIYEQILNDLNVNVILNKSFEIDYKIEDTYTYDLCIFANGLDKFKNTFDESEFILKCDDVLKLGKDYETIIENKKVLVIGGGNVAMDVARTLVRAHNKVEIVYRRNIKNAAASQKEIQDALNEGIIFNECFAPVKLNFQDNILYSLTVEKMNLVDDGGTRLNFIKTGIFKEITCDYIVEAIGQNGNYNYLKNVLPTLFDESGWIKEEGSKINNTTYFACGDYLTGASSFVNALKTSKEIVRKVKGKLW